MTGLGGLLLYQVADWTGAWLIIALICCVLSIVSILETVGRRSITSVICETPDPMTETNASIDDAPRTTS
ncbi:MAG TPA: hypothetical protein EYG03_00035 [Planctomycetes bacterium]|nr:hypothetical protein [Fuerstiella sp.]HIK90368.1 hypothetical protein [Planctomycetota bacterium]